MEILRQIELNGIIPVVKIDKIDDALPLVGSLYAGGLNIAEITFRTKCSEEAIKLIAKKCTNMVIGAGTVITPTQVEIAKEVGAKFIVTPGFNPVIVDKCLELDIPIIPGCSSASQVEQALERGLKVVKLFPAEQLGGLNMINALSEPYPMVKFLPTGGINEINMNNYLNHNKVIAIADSFIINEELVKLGKFDEITLNARNAINNMLGLAIHHTAINSNVSDGDGLLTSFNSFLGCPYVSNSAFAGGIIEIIKNPTRGQFGHIAFRTPNLERAIYYLEMRGFTIDPSSISRDNSGRISVVYFNQTLGGFALHLMKS